MGLATRASHLLYKCHENDTICVPKQQSYSSSAVVRAGPSRCGAQCKT